MVADAAGSKPKTHKTVSLPVPLLERARRVIERYPVLGYSTPSSFVEEALRRWIEREEERGMVLEQNAARPDPEPQEPKRRRQA